MEKLQPARTLNRKKYVKHLKLPFFFLARYRRLYNQKGLRKLSKEWMLKLLESLGLKHLDAEVYLYLVQNDPKKARDIAEALETYKRQLYRSLKSLQRKGMVGVSQDRPARFSAVSFDKVLDQFIKANRQEAQRIEQKKEQLLLTWQTEILEDAKG